MTVFPAVGLGIMMKVLWLCLIRGRFSWLWELIPCVALTSRLSPGAVIHLCDVGFPLVSLAEKLRRSINELQVSSLRMWKSSFPGLSDSTALHCKNDRQLNILSVIPSWSCADGSIGNMMWHYYRRQVIVYCTGVSRNCSRNKLFLNPKNPLENSPLCFPICGDIWG